MSLSQQITCCVIIGIVEKLDYSEMRDKQLLPCWTMSALTESLPRLY